MNVSALSGKRIVVTAGSTRAYIDAVRFISNYSSGRLGSLIAAECLRRGSEVRFLHGEGTLTPRIVAERGEAALSAEELSRLETIKIESVPHLAETLEHQLERLPADAVVHAMAVLDYIPDPAQVSTRKEKSDKQRWTIELVPTPKIIDLVKKTCPSTLLVGFKLEVGLDREALIASAKNLMERSGADLAVANDMADVQGNAYQAILLQRNPDGTISETPVKGRGETALLLCDRLGEMLAGRA